VHANGVLIEESKMKKRAVSFLLMGALLISAVIVSGCGSSGSSAAGSTSSAASGSSGSSSSGAPSASACAANARKQVAALEAPVHLSVPALPKSLASLNAKGKTVAFIGDTSAPVLADAYDGTAAAGKIVGIHVQLFNASAGIPAVDSAMSEAINEKVAAIVLSAESLKTVGSGLAAAAAANIPVVSQFETPLGATYPAVKGLVGISTATDGEKAAWYAMAQTKCKVNFAVVISADLDEQAQLAKNLANLFKTQCPTTCHLTTVNGSLAQTATPTTLTPLVTSTLQRNPNIQYIYADNGTESVALLQAVKTLGKQGKIKVLSEGGTANVASQLQDTSGGYTGALDPPTYSQQGWGNMDAVLRVMGGQKATVNLPQRLVLTGSSAAKNPLSSLNNYQSVYAKAWGVK
jgi:ABC-type sugar transport system substrate-binding protein